MQRELVTYSIIIIKKTYTAPNLPLSGSDLSLKALSAIGTLNSFSTAKWEHKALYRNTHTHASTHAHAHTDCGRDKDLIVSFKSISGKDELSHHTTSTQTKCR